VKAFAEGDFFSAFRRAGTACQDVAAQDAALTLADINTGTAAAGVEVPSAAQLMRRQVMELVDVEARVSVPSRLDSTYYQKDVFQERFVSGHDFTPRGKTMFDNTTSSVTVILRGCDFLDFC
jgi:hypothetical protein